MMTFCEECREMVEYTIEEITMEKEIKGKTIKFNGKEASCNFCGCKVFVPSLRDYNLKQMDDAYRKLENLITVEEIQQILGKYNIGKRPLSELLGWGELTITRYIDGAIPTKQYSEKLFEILNNINSMESILENNNNVLSDLAYKKCKEAILNLRQRSVIPEFEEMKIDSVVKYFLTNLSEVTPLALQKLLYYAQGFYKAFTGEFLFEEDCQA
ncbi:MAG: type II TA system antitoxin MqsA family protein, partial [Clostridiaceae bacterium]